MIRYFNTERQAIRAKRKFKKYQSTKRHSWMVQGNALVKVGRRK